MSAMKGKKREGKRRCHFKLENEKELAIGWSAMKRELQGQKQWSRAGLTILRRGKVSVAGGKRW